MQWSSPIWLFGLIPCSAVFVALLLRRHETARVPSIRFWQASPAGLNTRRSLRRLPRSWMLLIVAAVIAVVAAAGLRGGRSGRTLNIVFAGSASQLNDCFDRVSSVASRVDPSLAVSWKIPSNLRDHFAPRMPNGGSVQWIEGNRAAIQPESDDFSTIHIDANSGNARAAHLRLSAASPVQLVSVTAASRPCQLMVRLRNNEASGSVRVSVEGEHTSETTLKLPAAGETCDVFVEVPTLPQSALIRIADDTGRPLCDPAVWSADWLPARLIAVQPTSAAVRRFCEAYRSVHPPMAKSAAILIGSQISRDQAGVVTPITGSPVDNVTISQKSHPVLAHTDLSVLQVVPVALAAAPPEDWQVIAEANGRPMLAVREKPTRQVWLGFSADAFEQRDGFVVLLADAVDWVTQGGGEAGHFSAPQPTKTIPDDAAIERAVRSTIESSRDYSTLFCALSILAAGLAAVARR